MISLKFKIFIVIILPLSIVGCKTYNYAVDKTRTEHPYRTYYYSDKDRKYDFYTVLFAKEKDLGTSKNYTKFNIHISHMNLNSQHEHKGKYVSELIFDNIQNSDVTIFTSTIKLIHKNLEGEVIPYEKKVKDFENRSSYAHRYKQIYDPTLLPDSIVEYIHIEFELDGEKQMIEYTLPIVKTLHYTFWDVLMGV